MGIVPSKPKRSSTHHSSFRHLDPDHPYHQVVEPRYLHPSLELRLDTPYMNPANRLKYLPNGTPRNEGYGGPNMGGPEDPRNRPGLWQPSHDAWGNAPNSHTPLHARMGPNPLNGGYYLTPGPHGPFREDSKGRLPRGHPLAAPNLPGPPELAGIGAEPQGPSASASNAHSGSRAGSRAPGGSRATSHHPSHASGSHASNSHASTSHSSSRAPTYTSSRHNSHATTQAPSEHSSHGGPQPNRPRARGHR